MSKNAEFEECVFISCDNNHLEYANFSDATNTNIDLKTNYLKGTIFSRYEAQ